MTLLIALMLSLSGAAANAQTVKIISKLCAQSPSELRGSGVVVAFDKKTYILSSEHVVLHSTERSVCHSARTSDGRVIALQLIAADYLSGLSLLKPESDLESEVNAINTTPAPRARDQVEVTGYSYSSNTPGTSPGSIFNPQGSRALFFSTPSTIEINGAFGEFGMSGGAVTDPVTHELLGILSHQVLRVVPGRPSQVVENDGRSSIIDQQLLAIPARFAFNWARAILEGGMSPQLTRDPIAQLSGKEILRVANLRLEAVALQPGEVPVGGAHGSGIGGTDGTPLAGGISRIRITRVAGESWPTGLSLPSRLKWLERVAVLLERGVPIDIRTLVKRDESDESLSRIALESLTQAIASLRDPEVRPILNATSPTLLARYGLALERASLELLKLSSLDIQTLNLLKRLRLLAVLAQSENSDLITQEDIRRLDSNSAQKPVWDGLFVSHFDLTGELLENLTLMEQALKVRY